MRRIITIPAMTLLAAGLGLGLMVQPAHAGPVMPDPPLPHLEHGEEYCIVWSPPGDADGGSADDGGDDDGGIVVTVTVDGNDVCVGISIWISHSEPGL